MESEKIKIRFGQYEFEAEGPTSLIKEQFDRFMAAVESMAPKAEPAGRVLSRTVGDSVVVADGDTLATLAQATDGSAISEGLINRVFRRDGETLSLLALPQAEDGAAPDALVLLLYGYSKIQGKTSVSGYLLLKGARQSGLNLDRVDDPLAKRPEFVRGAGVRRGRTYTLNNRGVVYAETILRRLLE